MIPITIMESYYIALASSFVYIILRIIQIEWVDYEKHDKLIKKLLKESILVFTSIILGIYILLQLMPHYESAFSTPEFVFTDTPPF